ncbi:MAG: reverse transcriptase domain-containing protein [Blastocatellia bacterium]
MKRFGHLFEQIATFDNLLLAARKTLRGQKEKPEAARFWFDLEPELFRLQEELLAETWQPRPYRVFTVREPKRRQICASELRDRVAHHAICNVLDPVFERRMIHDSYACRVGKGAHAAVRRAREFSRRFEFYLQCDVRKYFASIEHAALKSLLRRMLKDDRTLALLDRIIDHPLPGSPPGRGLPIGNLTSQYFANLYLGELDHFVKERLGIEGYERYMDDGLIFGDDKPSLHRTLAAVRTFLDERLKLELKEETVRIAPVSAGISFLGSRVFPGMIRLGGGNWRRFRRAVREREAAYLAGEIDERTLARSVSSMTGHLMHADTLAARRRFFYNSRHLG